MLSEADEKYNDNLEIIELLEASAYIVACTEDIQLQDFQEVCLRMIGIILKVIYTDHWKNWYCLFSPQSCW